MVIHDEDDFLNLGQSNSLYISRLPLSDKKENWNFYWLLSNDITGLVLLLLLLPLVLENQVCNFPQLLKNILETIKIQVLTKPYE